MLEVSARSKSDTREILSRSSIEQRSPTPRWSTWPCKYCSPYSGHAVVRVPTSGRPSSQRMRNGGLQYRIHVLEGLTTTWGLTQGLYKLTSRLRLGTKSLSLENRASHLSWN